MPEQVKPITLTITASDEWPAGVSDGLILPCQCCGSVTSFDYGVDDEFWRLVVPSTMRLGVVCLPCLDRIATERGLDVSEHLERVQFTGIGKTIELIPVRIVRYTPHA